MWKWCWAPWHRSSSSRFHCAQDAWRVRTAVLKMGSHSAEGDRTSALKKKQNKTPPSHIQLRSRSREGTVRFFADKQFALLLEWLFFPPISFSRTEVIRVSERQARHLCILHFSSTFLHHHKYFSEYLIQNELMIIWFLCNKLLPRCQKPKANSRVKHNPSTQHWLLHPILGNWWT